MHPDDQCIPQRRALIIPLKQHRMVVPRAYACPSIPSPNILIVCRLMSRSPVEKEWNMIMMYACSYIPVLISRNITCSIPMTMTV